MKFLVICVSCLFDNFKKYSSHLSSIIGGFQHFWRCFLRVVDTLRFPTYFVLLKNDPWQDMYIVNSRF